MSEEIQTLQKKWDERYRQHQKEKEAPRAAQVLEDFQHLLPNHGEALDLACGRGGNARFLASEGLSVQAWDLSPVAIDELNQFAIESNLSIKAEVRDVIATPPAPNSCDVIVVSYFLERDLAPILIKALRPGGLVFYQTFIRDKTSETGPSNPHFLLDENELLELFRPLVVRAYREEGSIGNIHEGLRNEALLVAQVVK